MQIVAPPFREDVSFKWRRRSDTRNDCTNEIATFKQCAKFDVLSFGLPVCFKEIGLNERGRTRAKKLRKK
jgi:hypothetical protein